MPDPTTRHALASREQELRTLFELSQTFGRSLDGDAILNRLVFALMGQMFVMRVAVAVREAAASTEAERLDVVRVRGAAAVPDVPGALADLPAPRALDTTDPMEAALVGAGFGVAFSSMANLIVAAVPHEQTGVASGMNANIRTIGGAIGSALMASVVTAHMGPGGLPREAGYVNGFLLLTAALVLAALAALLIPAVRRDPITHEEPNVPLRHPEAALMAGGTLVGDDPE